MTSRAKCRLKVWLQTDVCIGVRIYKPDRNFFNFSGSFWEKRKPILNISGDWFQKHPLFRTVKKKSHYPRNWEHACRIGGRGLRLTRRGGGGGDSCTFFRHSGILFLLFQHWHRGTCSPPPPPRNFQKLPSFPAKKCIFGQTTWFSGNHWIEYSGKDLSPLKQTLVAYAYMSLCYCLKPQDSFGEFDPKKSLNLQKVQEIIRKHLQTFLQLFWMTYCNAILPSCKFIINDVHLWKGVRGTPNISMFLVISWKWKHLGANC